MMEEKQARLDAGNKLLEKAGRMVDGIKESILPYTPHLLTVQEDNPRSWNPAEFQFSKMPFEDYEVYHLQYLTFVGAHGDRGIARPRGDWQDMIDKTSPMATNSTVSTPNPKEAKVPKVKMTREEYQRWKRDGIKPSPRPVGPEENKPGHSRTASQVSAEAMSRGPSFEGSMAEEAKGAERTNGVHASASARPNLQNSRPREDSSGADLSRAVDINGASAQPLVSQQTKYDARPHEYKHISKPVQPLKHALPPRPQSPPRRNGKINHSAAADTAGQQRVNDTSRSTQPEKRQKIEQPATPHKRKMDSGEATQSAEKRSKVGHTRNLSNTQKSTTRQLETSPLAASSVPHRSRKSSQSSPQPKKDLSKSTETKGAGTSSAQKSVDLPPLLSPLPADLDNSPESSQLAHTHISNEKRPAATKAKPAQDTPSRSHIGQDTIVVRDPIKKPHVSQSALQAFLNPSSSHSRSDAGRASPPFVLPPLLSPTLPPVIEKELDRLHEKAEKAKYESLKSRNEKVRRADAPGVARKMPKVGHPPKKQRRRESSSAENDDRPESSRAHTAAASGGTERNILRLKYKKSRAKDIQRILNMRPRPSSEFRQLEEKRLAEGKYDDRRGKQDDDSDEDVPLSKIAPASSAVASSRKRASDEITSEPAPKRAKPSHLDVARSKASADAAFKSPALSSHTPAKKDLLSTPTKKSDSLKSTAMHRISSTDSHAHTPQASTSISTPASAEKPRDSAKRSSAALDASKYLSESGYGRLSKREMDRLLKPFLHLLISGRLDEIVESDVLLGFCRGLECLIAYNIGFSIQQGPLKRKASDWESAVRLWEFLSKYTEHFPVCYHLTWQIGAFFREELDRVYTGLLSERVGQDDTEGKEMKELSEKMMANIKNKDKCWRRTAQSKDSIKEFVQRQALHDVLGPWTNYEQLKVYTFTYLTRFSEEKGLGWKRMYDD